MKQLPTDLLDLIIEEISGKEKQHDITHNGYGITMFTRQAIKEVAIEFAKQQPTEKLQTLNQATIKKIIEDLKHESKIRYQGGKRKSYDMEHLYDDLEFVLNHLHL